MDLVEKQKMQQRQSLPLDQKIQMTKQRIKAWIEHWQDIEISILPRNALSNHVLIEALEQIADNSVYLAFSGGKDSTVLKHIIESMGYNVPSIFSNTGLEMPEIVEFVRRQKNVIEIKPKLNYRDAWKKEGLPIGSKKVARQIRTLKKGSDGQENTYKLYDEGITSGGHNAPSWKLAKKWRKFIDSDIRTSEKCCDHLKKEPIATFEKKTGLKGRSFTGMMASEGGYRETMTQCNTFTGKTTRSSPMLFWTDADVWAYIEKYNVEICSVYYQRAYVNGDEVANDSPFTDLPTVAEIECGTELNINIVTAIQGESRTGCMFCGFGAHLDKGLNRFQKMSVTHPRQHAIVMDRMGMREAMEMINVKVDYED